MVLKKIFNRKKKTIALTCNIQKFDENGNVPDKYREFDAPTTIDAIKKGIEKQGFEVLIIEADENFIENILKHKDKIYFAFNIAEGMSGNSREAQVPAILDMLEIPYSGAGVLTQAITLNKDKTNDILFSNGVPVPISQLFITGKEELKKNMSYPLIVKPNAEGSSKGITNNSLVNNEKELRKQLQYVIKNYKQPAIVQEFCTGTEFTVAIIGNDKPKVLPFVEVIFDHLPKGINPIDSDYVKWVLDNPDSTIETVRCPAKIDKKLQKTIEEIALKTYNVLDCKDFTRMDIRLDSKGIPKVLDVNALPGLIPDPKENSRFPKSCYAIGMSYEKIIATVLKEAMKRYKL